MLQILSLGSVQIQIRFRIIISSRQRELKDEFSKRGKLKITCASSKFKIKFLAIINHSRRIRLSKVRRYFTLNKACQMAPLFSAKKKGIGCNRNYPLTPKAGGDFFHRAIPTLLRLTKISGPRSFLYETRGDLLNGGHAIHGHTRIGIRRKPDVSFEKSSEISLHHPVPSSRVIFLTNVLHRVEERPLEKNTVGSS